MHVSTVTEKSPKINECQARDVKNILSIYNEINHGIKKVLIQHGSRADLGLIPLKKMCLEMSLEV